MLPVPQKVDSSYKKIERVQRRFNKLHVPKALQAALPFKTKPKEDQKKTSGKRKSFAQKRAVVLEPHEKKEATMMQQLHTMHAERERKRKKKVVEKRNEFAKKRAREDAEVEA